MAAGISEIYKKYLGIDEEKCDLNHIDTDLYYSCEVTPGSCSSSSCGGCRTCSSTIVVLVVQCSSC